jgi:hypothetical protein
MYSELGERFPWQAPVVEQAAAVYFRGPKNCIHAQFYLIVLTPLERLHHPVVLCCLGWIFFVYASSCTGQEGKMLHGMCKQFFKLWCFNYSEMFSVGSCHEHVGCFCNQ